MNSHRRLLLKFNVDARVFRGSVPMDGSRHSRVGVRAVAKTPFFRGAKR